MSIYVEEIEFVLITPGCCGVPWMMPKHIMVQRKEDHKTFWCPNCQSSRWYPPGSSDKEKLEAKLRHERFLRVEAENEAESAKHRERAQKAAKTRLKNRIKNGVCPCCTRYFENLHRHMLSQHGDWVANSSRIKTIRENKGLSQTAIAKLIGIPAPYISLYERQKLVPADAVAAIESFIEKSSS